MTAKPSELEYKPANMEFFQDYCDYFAIKVTKRKEEYKMRIYDGEGKEMYKTEHETEKEMVAEIKRYLNRTKKIDRIKKIFKPMLIIAIIIETEAIFNDFFSYINE